MTDPSTIAEGVTLDGDPTDAPRRALVVYHRDGLEVVPIVPEVPIVIGRTEPSDIRPRSRRLSRQHASFALVEGEVWIEDLKSTNGTFVNGRRIDVPTRMSLGDEVTLGSVTVSLHGLDEAWLRPLGLEGHDRFEQLVETELDRARTFERPLSILMIRARDPGGPRLGSWVPKLAEMLRLVDKAALFGPDCVEVLLPEMDPKRAVAFAHEVVARLADVMEVGVGVACWPTDGPSAAQLTEAARNAVMSATPEHPVEAHRDRSEMVSLAVSEGPVVRDPAMAALYRTIDRVASSAISVLIIGETGTGKELIAREVHERSERRTGPMRVINCGAIPEGLLESILFGHERGAFTGADQRRTGVFEEAEGGTVFLDEIGELSLQAQVALLRVLETRRIQRVGSSKEVPVDVRVLAATHRNLEAMCDDGSFRWDLLYRLNGITLMVPPLRDRVGDIRAMVGTFVQDSNKANGRAVRGLAADVMPLLERYRWPGNVRELRNTIDRAVVIAVGDLITVEDLPERLVAQVDLSRMPTEAAAPFLGRTEDADAPELDLKERVKTYEITLIRSALHEAHGNQTAAADLLGIPRRTLVYKIRSFGIRDGEAVVPSPIELDRRGKRVEFGERIERFERELIREVLGRCAGDLASAARLLNIQRRTLTQKMERYGVPG